MIPRDDTLPDTPEIGIDLEGPRVTLRHLIQVTSRFVRILESVDREVLHRQRASFEWVITDMSAGSAHVLARPNPLARAETPVWADLVIVQTLRAGVSALQEGAAPPQAFPRSAIDEVLSIVEMINDDVTAINVRAGTAVIPISRATAMMTAIADSRREEGLGSVEGRVEMVTVHGQRYFNLYDELTGEPVRCYFGPQLLETVRASLNKRVLVYGFISNKISGGGRDSIRVLEIRPFPDDQLLPDIGAMRGFFRA